MLQYYWAKLCRKIIGVAIKNSKIDKTCKIGAGSHIVNATFGRYSYCAYDCKIINCNVGSFCSIGDNVVIGRARHPMEWVSMSPAFYAGKHTGVEDKFSEFDRPEDLRTDIGNDVWIGDNVMIKAGVIIGDGAVIGMGSVVTKDVMPYAIVAGVPAKKIKMRFSEDAIQKLEALQWWNLENAQIRKYAKYIREPDKFLEEIAKSK